MRGQPEDGRARCVAGDDELGEVGAVCLVDPEGRVQVPVGRHLAMLR